MRIQSEVVSDMTAPDSDPTPMRTPVMVPGGARPETPIMESTPSAPSIMPSHLQTQPLIPRRILSSTPSGKNGDNMDKIVKLLKMLRKEYL